AFSTVSDSAAWPWGEAGVVSAVIAGSGPFVTRAGGAAGLAARRRVPPVYERRGRRGRSGRALRPGVRPERHPAGRRAQGERPTGTSSRRPLSRSVLFRRSTLGPSVLGPSALGASARGALLPLRAARPLLRIAQRLLAHGRVLARPLRTEVRGGLVLALLLPAERDRRTHVAGADVEGRDEVEHVRAEAPQQPAQVPLDLTAALGGDHAREQEPGEVVVDRGEAEEVPHVGEHGAGALILHRLDPGGEGAPAHEVRMGAGRVEHLD